MTLSYLRLYSLIAFHFIYYYYYYCYYFLLTYQLLKLAAQLFSCSSTGIPSKQDSTCIMQKLFWLIWHFPMLSSSIQISPLNNLFNHLTEINDTLSFQIGGILKRAGLLSFSNIKIPVMQFTNKDLYFKFNCYTIIGNCMSKQFYVFILCNIYAFYDTVYIFFFTFKSLI